jgi:hypothetical protein
VLFADVVRSMDIAAAVDMERLRDIQRTHESLRATANGDDEAVRLNNNPH